MTLKQLKQQAGQSAGRRGHCLNWQPLTVDRVRGTCRHCGMSVDCTTRPAPNDIDIGGEAVALTCRGKQTATARYCGPCDRWVPATETSCRRCGADTDRQS